MGLFTSAVPPRLADAPDEYDPSYMARMLNVLTLYFLSQNAVQPLNIARLNIDINTLPTEASLATLRVGDVYRYTVDNSLRIKV
jgi:hypothetical protein